MLEFCGSWPMNWRSIEIIVHEGCYERSRVELFACSLKLRAFSGIAVKATSHNILFRGIFMRHSGEGSAIETVSHNIVAILTSPRNYEICHFHDWRYTWVNVVSRLGRVSCKQCKQPRGGCCAWVSRSYCVKRTLLFFRAKTYTQKKKSAEARTSQFVCLPSLAGQRTCWDDYDQIGYNLNKESA